MNEDHNANPNNMPLSALTANSDVFQNIPLGQNPQMAASMLSNPHLLQSFASLMSAFSAPPQQQQMQMPAQMGLTLPPEVFTTLPDVYKHNKPVGTSPNDEELLVKALFEAKRTNVTYRRALDEMHGVNYHSANLWKDYYLEHTFRLNARVSLLSASSVGKKPLHPATQGNGEARPKKARIDDREPVPSSSRTPLPRILQTSGTGRQPVARPSLPRPPSREPMPPTTIIRAGRGNMFTAEDKKYFVDYITWELKADPSLRRMDLVRGLSQKAPQHSELSWNHYWARGQHIADRIIAAAHGDHSPESELEDEDEDDEENEADEDDGEEEKPWTNDSHAEREGSVDITQYLGGDDDDPSREELVRDMGEGGGAYTPADFRAMAKHVVAHKNWDEMTPMQRWFPFHEAYPQRTYAGWSEGYRKRERAILKLAERYRRDERRNTGAIPPQHGRPSWSGDHGQSPSQKRKIPP
ncbi:hypothetical protein BV25DRAFT_1829494 [Artomyces pyxidatus]|uniref:Uncharacterized protein n=1 Tax=Artomyces pyxidatus TaxID=48021 RepID=A0ACB8SQZ9_9AGAM|nr:hypothetical protein BV25DRAFT_1829494 [Artomyces pyxidatus]